VRKHLVVLTVAAAALGGCSAASADRDDPAAADAKAACDTLDRMGTLVYSKKSMSSYEFAAATSLATAAAGRDKKYEPLKDALTRASDAAASTFDPANPSTTKNIKKAKDFCADL
jgi:hypothetical protein